MSFLIIISIHDLSMIIPYGGLVNGIVDPG